MKEYTASELAVTTSQEINLVIRHPGHGSEKVHGGKGGRLVAPPKKSPLPAKRPSTTPPPWPPGSPTPKWLAKKPKLK